MQIRHATQTWETQDLEERQEPWMNKEGKREQVLWTGNIEEMVKNKPRSRL